MFYIQLLQINRLDCARVLKGTFFSLRGFKFKLHELSNLYVHSLTAN